MAPLIPAIQDMIPGLCLMGMVPIVSLVLSYTIIRALIIPEKIDYMSSGEGQGMLDD